MFACGEHTKLRVDTMDERKELAELIIKLTPQEREELLKKWKNLKEKASA